jgi:hypothetical protein
VIAKVMTAMMGNNKICMQSLVLSLLGAIHSSFSRYTAYFSHHTDRRFNDTKILGFDALIEYDHQLSKK